MIYPGRTSVTVYESSLVISIKLLRVEFDPENRALKMW